MRRKFPGGRTAFLVIHGIGEQNRFETLDSFTRGLVNLLKSKNVRINAVHKIAGRKDVKGTGNTESFVRLTTPTQGKNLIDIYEYYWAPLTEEKISVPEVWNWAKRTLQRTKNLYREDEELARNYEKRIPLLEKLQKYLWRWSFLYTLIKLLRRILFHSLRIINIPFISPFIQKKFEEIEGYVSSIIIRYIGDIAIYTAVDEKSRFFLIRQQILTESQTLLEEILADRPDRQYDRVIIAGHSLGSVIAYDTLNRLNIKANADDETNLQKIKGLITFGSPLDKVSFFFHEHASREQCVRRQIIEHLHSFKVRKLDLIENAFPLFNTIIPKLNDICWVNYYNDNDPISDRLVFYDIEDENNVNLDLIKPWGLAHIEYWEHLQFYEDIAKRFLSIF